MQDQFDIMDEYGNPNRFVIRDKRTKLNIVCVLTPGANEFTLTVITVMTKDDFKTDTWVVEV